MSTDDEQVLEGVDPEIVRNFGSKLTPHNCGIFAYPKYFCAPNEVRGQKKKSGKWFPVRFQDVIRCPPRILTSRSMNAEWKLLKFTMIVTSVDGSEVLDKRLLSIEEFNRYVKPKLSHFGK